MKKWIVSILLGGILVPSISQAIDLKQSKFTQVVNNVEVIAATDHSRHAATVNGDFKMPDVLRTGPNSRAELAATDGTITRVGANTIFSYDQINRTIDLQQGSLLFHSPHGKGGGTIRTGSATASVIGTTIIVTCTPNGGFKLLDLEGQAEVRYLSGLNQTLQPGQMTFILPAGSASPIVVFRLDSETKGSALVSGFTTPLDSSSKINSEITQQLLQILNGTAADTGLIVGNNATPTTVQVVQDINNQRNSGTPPPPPPGFQTDGSIVGSDEVSTLPVNYPPLDPNHTVTSSFTVPSGIESFSDGLLFLGIANPASGFVGNNIDIDTASVDLSSFAGKSDFDVMATGDLRIWQSVDFNSGPEPDVSESELPAVVSLFAGGQMLITCGSTLEADTTTFGLVADSFGTLDTDTGIASVCHPDALENISLINNDGAIQILSVSDFTLEDDSSISVGNDGTGLGLEIESEGALTLGSESSSLGLDCRSYDVTIDSGGDVDLVASGDIGVNSTRIEADGGDINITAGGTIDIEDSHLEAYDTEDVDLSTPGAKGNIMITGAGVTIDDTYIYGDADVDISGTETIGIYDGTTVEADTDVNIAASDGGVDIDDSQIYADGYVSISDDVSTLVGGNITISGVGTVGIYDDSTIDASTDASITSSGGDVDIKCSYVYAGDSDFGGSVNLTADVGDVNISCSYISASGDVVTSGEGSSAITTIVGGDVNITAGGNVGIYCDSTIDAGADVNITASDGDVDIEGSSTVYAGDSDFGGSITVAADTGNVYISDSYLSASEEDTGGDVTITAGGYIDIENSDLYADDEVSLTAGGFVKVHDSQRSPDLSMDGWNVEAGTYVNLSADGDLDISGSIIYADDGDVTIAAGGTIEGSIDISDDTTIDAAGNVDITDEGTISLSVNGSSSSSSAFNISADSSDIYADSGNLTIIDGGEVEYVLEDSASIDDVSYSDNNISISESTISISSDSTSGGSLSIVDNGSVSISGDDTTSTSISDASLSADNISVCDSTISISISSDSTSGGSVSIVDNGTVSISSDDTSSASISDSSFNANGISVCDSTISISSDSTSGGSVCIVDNGALYISGGSVFISDSSDLEANDISINDSSLTANDSNVRIINNGDVSINSDDTASIDDASVSDNNISVSDDSTISISSDSTSDGGSVSIIDNGTVSISSDFVDISDSADLEVNNVSITGSTLTADDNDVNIINNGYVSIAAGDTSSASIDDASFSANNISICSSTISISSDSSISIASDSTSGGGSVSIIDNGTVSISGDFVEISDSSDLEVNNISITGSTLTANDGDVSVINNGSISISGGDTAASISDSTISANNITINNSTLTAKGGDVNIYDYGQVLGGPDTCDSDISVNDILICGSTLNAYALDSVGGDVNISGNGAVELDNSTINADGNVNITSEQAVVGDAIYDESGGVTVNGGSINAGNNLKITANGIAGTTIKNGASLNAFYISVNSPDGILINQDGTSSTYTGNQLNLTAGVNAGQEIRVNNANFSSFASINMSANTLWIVNTDLGSGIVNLASQSGHVNVNTGYHPFDINLDGDIYNHVDITTPTQVTSGIGTTAGLFSHHL